MMHPKTNSSTARFVPFATTALLLITAFTLLALPGVARAGEKGTQMHTYWLEIATHGAGAFDSEWRTLAVARNTGSAQASVTFVLHTESGDHEITETIPAGAQGVFDDIVGAMGVEGKGSIEIRSNQPLDVVGRIYNQADDGTFGQFLDGYDEAGGLSQGESAYLLGLRQVEGEYRTNLSVTNTGSAPATVTITLFSIDGTQIDQYTLEPGPSEVIQDSEPFRRRAHRPNLGWGFARVTATSGSGILTSASVVDSLTNDATTIAMKRMACGNQDLTNWLEIATHGAGAFDSVWRTLAVARNTGDSAAVVTFVLHTTSGDHEITETIPAGAQGVFDDIVGAMGVEDKGSIEIRSNQPLDVVGRIYNQADEGTFGQFLAGSPAGTGLERGETAWLLGLRQVEDEYRSNLSVTNTGALPAVVEITLYATEGAELTTYQLEPGPFAVIQDSEPFRRRANRPNLGWGFARVEVISGSGILTSASVVDSRTNDATTIAMKRSEPETGCPAEFAGIVLLVATGENELTVAWTPALDDATPPAEMSYHVHLSTEQDFEPGPGTLAATVQGAAQIVLQGLEAATEFHAVVLAEDGDGNLSTGGDAWSARTLEFMPVKKPGAVVETAEALGLGEATKSGSTLIFEKTAGAILPTVGAQFIGPVTGGGGFLRTVESVFETASEIRVETSEASLEDGYEQFQLLSSGTIPDVEGGTRKWAERWHGDLAALPTGMSVQHEIREDGSRVGRVTWPDRLVSIETVRHAGSAGEFEFEPGAGPGEFVAITKTQDYGTVTLEAGVDFHPELITDATWTWGGVQTAEVIARGQLDIHALATYEWTAAGGYEETIPIFTTSWLAVYSVGPVPVYQKITLSLDAEISASASAAIKAEAAASASTVVEVGVRYTKASGWQAISGFDFSRSLAADLSVVGGVEAEVRLVPKLEVEFYEVIAAWITIEPSVSGEIMAEGTSMAGCAPIQLTNFDFDLEVEAKVGIDFTLFGSYTLFDATVWDPAPWDLFSLPESALGLAGAGPVELVANVTDGVGNPFDDRSVEWRVSPATAEITAGPDPRRATLTCDQDGNYTVTFSGYGRLGELGRRCFQREVSCQAEDVPPAGKPVLTATAVSASAVDLSWTAVNGATGYRLYRDGSQVYSGAGRSYADKGLAAETRYCYKVRGYNDAGDGPDSSERCATTEGGGGGDEITITLPGGVTMELVYIPAGTFWMGSPADERGRDSDEDLHEVTLTQGYYMGKYEVTQAQWEAVMGSNPAHDYGVGADYPVYYISWNDICGGSTGSDCAAESFIGELNSYLGTGAFRMATEAEWERAARAGTQTEFSFAAPPDWDIGTGSFPEAKPYMWWGGNNDPYGSKPVGSKLPNPYGLYDMHGNLYEWVADWYETHLETGAQTNPEGPISVSYRVFRGGYWNGNAQYCRSANRYYYSPGYRNDGIGFRLARSE